MVSYTVMWKAVAGDKRMIRTQQFMHLDDAMNEARLFSIGMAEPVEVTVTGHDGQRHLIEVRGPKNA